MQAEGIIRLAAKALANGGQLVQPTRVEWDLSGNCLMPVGRDITYRQPKKALGTIGGHTTVRDSAGVITSVQRNGEKPFNRSPMPCGFVVGLTLRCRKCDKCRHGRRLLWSRRALKETAESSRTWFGTITLSPQARFHNLTRSRAKLAKQGVDFDREDYRTQFGVLVQSISPEITKYLKRVRKESAATIRYLWVCEAHQSGDPHFHALVHERNPDQHVPYRILSDQWKLGFTQWKLVTDVRQATYLTKYLSKSTAARVRSSVRYGKDDLDVIGFKP